ncbi:MAG: hypothetical protein GY758_02150 [Fuerstiella sp.]|nr:hypothetical protein [Fuerstiella sp.]MCP4509393.1 hypothetical protein [Fuerstiella sp.]
MKRIFLSLVVISTILLVAAATFGLNIGDARSLDTSAQSRVSMHMLVGLGALTFATLVHAICLTYFMGTGRWIEETSNAYSLEPSWYDRTQRLKYRTVGGMVLCVLLLISVGAFGAVADPATSMSLDGTLGMTSAQIHFFVAGLTVLTNILTNVTQFVAISRNSVLVDGVLAEVCRIREDRGLPV